MLVIRMQRMGRKRQPSFRLIIQDKTRSPQSKHVEIVGFYNPRTKEKGFKEDRINYWLDKGALPTDTVNNLLVDAGLIHAEKRRTVTLSDARKAQIAEATKKAEEEKKEKEEAPVAAEEAPVEVPAAAEENKTPENQS